LIITLVFKKNAIFFAENCDHDYDPSIIRDIFRSLLNIWKK
jgi:hypothetical protein